MERTDASTALKLLHQAPMDGGRIESTDTEVVDIPTAALSVADSPRINGPDPQHVQTLVEIEGPLPPIIVHRETMWVIDGAHRLIAAQVTGRETIAAVFFHGSRDEAFQLAVKANVTHGLPLTQTDRQSAAARILATHPEMSDRSIASTAGLAARTVAAIRQRTAGAVDVDFRVGNDGRARPLDASAGRRLASMLIEADPSASLRNIAQRSGISVGTVRDVRARLEAGEDPVPSRRRRSTDGEAAPLHPRPAKLVRNAPPTVDLDDLLGTLQRDPALRYSDSGRALLRWLLTKCVPSGQWHAVIDNIPTHSAIMVARVARECAASWMELAQELDSTADGCLTG